MRHLIILLPGVMGSALQKDGKDAWALSGQALVHYLSTLRNSIEQLRIIDDDWQRDDLGDGIRAVRLIEDIISIPYLVEHAGYAVITQQIKEYFDVSEGSIYAPSEDANFFTFPYDWRRDNRASARKLQRFVEKQLPAWRAWSGAADAKVILIGHSMGGLISRYYVEVLGGWRDCLKLFTVGSPHRGAIKVLNLMSNGLSIKGLHLRRLTEILRSFPSAYQILPTYPVVEVNGKYVRIGEINSIPNVDQQLANAARNEFLDAIRQAAIENRSDLAYRQRTILWIGIRQDTVQSARLSDGKLIISYDPPAGLDPALTDGDGTVPRVSAIPADLEGQGFERFAVERHAWLTNNDMTLQPLLETLKQISAPGAPDLYGVTKEGSAVRPAINLRLESLFFSNEPVTIHIKLMDVGEQPQSLGVRVHPVGHAGTDTRQVIQANGTEATVMEVGELSPGLYELTVFSQASNLPGLAPTHGVFEVVDPSVTLD